MKYLIDTDWVIDHLSGRANTVQAIDTFSRAGMGISLITYGEVYEGIYYGRNPMQAEIAFTTFLRWVKVVPLDQEIMRRFAAVRGELRRTGWTVSDTDLLIASTAIVHDVELVTRNLRHFERIDNLRIYQTLQ